MRILHLSAGDEIEIAELPPILRGEKGETGPRGSDGTNGTNGTNGANGKSAFELAQDAGYQWSVAAWLNSLRGATGPAGIVWRGAWSASAAYSANDAVRHAGAVYRAGINIASTDGLVPGVSNFWVLLVQDGAQGPAGVSTIITSFSNRAAYDAYTPAANELVIYTGI